MSQPSGLGGSGQVMNPPGGQGTGQIDEQLVPGTWSGKQVPETILQPLCVCALGQNISCSPQTTGQIGAHSDTGLSSQELEAAKLGLGFSMQMSGLGQPWVSSPPEHVMLVNGSQTVGQNCGHIASLDLSMQYLERMQ